MWFPESVCDIDKGYRDYKRVVKEFSRSALALHVAITNEADSVIDGPPVEDAIHDLSTRCEDVFGAYEELAEEDERVDTIPIDFCDEIPGILGEMEEAFEAGDDEGLKKFSHQLVKFLNKKN
jgi:hypothetical protein